MSYFDHCCKHISKEITGIVHVGAHQCEERDTYLELFRQTDSSILWIEALPDLVDEMKAKYPEIQIVQAICSDKERDSATFYISNYSQCAGLYPFSKEHKDAFSTIEQIGVEVPHTTLDKLISKADKPKRNMLVVSVNGAELQVLKGAETLLEFVDFVFVRFEKAKFHTMNQVKSETPMNEEKKDLPTFYELNDWLGMNGFLKMESISISDYSEGLFYISIDAELELKKRDKEMTDMFQLMVEEYNQKNGTEVKTEVYRDEI